MFPSLGFSSGPAVSAATNRDNISGVGLNLNALFDERERWLPWLGMAGLAVVALVMLSGRPRSRRRSRRKSRKR